MEVAALLIGLLLVAVAVGTLIHALTASAARSAEVVEQIGTYGFRTPGEETLERGRTVGEVAAKLGTAVRRRRGPRDESGVRDRLIAAGWYTMNPTTFLGYQVLGAVALTIIWAFVGPLADISTPIYVVGLIIAALAGWYLPSTFLTRAIQDRHDKIEKRLPELIDLLVVAVESGMGFIAALRMTSKELDGPLAAELKLMLQEQTMGLQTSEAMINMRQRADTPGMRSFVRGVVQGETLGISIAQILRNVADEMRKRRKAWAEERAQKAPVKMLFPLVFCIFPAIFVVILGPAMIQLSGAFNQT
jgi:tight adherence protein C